MTSLNPFEDIQTSEQQHSVLINISVHKNDTQINNMSVGDVRQCFQQMRNTPNLTSSTVLWCGITAGQFALAYLLQTAQSSAKRRRNKKQAAHTSNNR